MSFSKEWDDIYNTNTHLSVWPWSDLVSYVMRYARPVQNSEYNVLELGLGAGANIPFFEWLDVNYYGVEGSPTIVNRLHEKYYNLRDKIVAADFTKEIPFDERFHLVVDRGSLTCNNTYSIIKSLEIIKSKMSSGDSFVGIDWFSTNHSDYSKGDSFIDEFTCLLSNGHLAGVGYVHFSTKNHIIELFKGFEVKILEEKIIRRNIPSDGDVIATWNFYAVKL